MSIQGDLMLIFEIRKDINSNIGIEQRGDTILTSLIPFSHFKIKQSPLFRKLPIHKILESQGGGQFIYNEALENHGSEKALGCGN